MKYLVDTSIWISHLQTSNSKLSELLKNNEVLAHDFVIGEVFIGHIKNRFEILDLLHYLPKSVRATEEEVISFSLKQKLIGKGLGWIDMHLLASAKLSGAGLLTNDKAMAAAAKKIGVVTS